MLWACKAGGRGEGVWFHSVFPWLVTTEFTSDVKMNKGYSCQAMPSKRRSFLSPVVPLFGMPGVSCSDPGSFWHSLELCVWGRKPEDVCADRQKASLVDLFQVTSLLLDSCFLLPRSLLLFQAFPQRGLCLWCCFVCSQCCCNPSRRKRCLENSEFEPLSDCSLLLEIQSVVFPIIRNTTDSGTVYEKK